MLVPSTRAADAFNRRAFTVEDLRRMVEVGIVGEHERIELIAGDLVALTPNVVVHELIKSELSLAITRAAQDDVFVGVATTLQLAHDVLVDPDIIVMPHTAFAAGRSGFAEPPPSKVSLIIEIAASDLRYEGELKKLLYARCGIQEYWVIDAHTRVAWVHTGPSDDGWSSVVERAPIETLTTTALPNLAIRLADID